MHDNPILHRKTVGAEILPVSFRSFHSTLDNRCSDFDTAFTRTPDEFSHDYLPDDRSLDPRIIGPITVFVAILVIVIWGPRTLTRN